MLSESGFKKIVRASAWYDLVVTAPLATPWTLAWFLSQLAQLHERLGLPGTVPAYDTSVGLFANLLGSVVVVWSLVRIRSPQAWLGRFDALSRYLFAAWMLYALAHGATAALVLYVVVELAWGIGQSLPVRSRTACC